MTGIKRPLIITAFMFALGISAFAQKGIEPLSPTATQAETQAWLVKTLGKNSSYNIDLTKKSLDGIKFDGCTLNYIMRSETRADTMGSATPDDSASNAREESGARSSAAQVHINLVDINGDNVQAQDIPNNKKVKAIAMESVAGKTAVSIGASKSKMVEKPTIGVMVKAEAADALKAGFAQAIKLCQAGTPATAAAPAPATTPSTSPKN
jgi:hypothetical protein